MFICNSKSLQNYDIFFILIKLYRFFLIFFCFKLFFLYKRLRNSIWQ
jgi:hypothetical protein